MPAEQAMFDATRLQGLIGELPVKLPDQLPGQRNTPGEELVTLFNAQVRRLNPWYGDPQPDEIKIPFSDEEEGDEVRSVLASDLYVRSRSILRAGKSAVLLESVAGFFDMAPDDAPTAEWEFRETDKMLLNLPMSRLGADASLAIIFLAKSIRENQTATEATYQTAAAWELRLPHLHELSAFGAREEDVVTVSGGSVVGKYFPDTRGLIRDLPVIRTIPGTGTSGRVSNHSLGLIKGGEFEEGTTRELIGVGAAILEAADRSSFKPLGSSN